MILQNWAGGLAVIVGTVLVQFTVQTHLVKMVVAHGGTMDKTGREAPQCRLWMLSLFTVFSLIFGHLAQISLWTLLYLILGEMSGFADAVYFSLASYTTVGAEGIELSRGHRVLGALEAAMGTLMFGWSTALLVALVVRTEVLSAQRDGR